jgi:hypothetical protein
MSKHTIRALIVLGTLAVLAAIGLVACTPATTTTPTPCPACPDCPTCPQPTPCPTEVVPPAAKPNEAKSFVVFSPGTANVPPGVPVYLRAGIAEPAADAAADAAPVAAIKVVPMFPAMGEINPDTLRAKGIKSPREDATPPTADKVSEAPYAWTLVSAPEGSAAALLKEVAEVSGLGLDVASFTPDKEGVYTISLVVTTEDGKQTQAGEIKVTAAKYAGNESCKGCHAKEYEGWSKTAHGTAFQRYVNENAEGEYFTAGYGCARCHTVGYYPVAASTAGWWERLASPDNWPMSTIALNAFNSEEGKDTFTSAFTPEVQAVSNIGCESCHGPSSAHVAAPGADTAPVATADSTSCDQCHNAGGHHTRGAAMANSSHSNNAELGEGTNPSCSRCHSPEGFVDTAKGSAEPRAINGNIGCATCHDPHSDANAFQLRMVDTATVTLSPASESFTVEDAGLSATCFACHNARRAALTVEDEKATRFTPHASTAAEFLTGVGGYSWGFQLENSEHVNIGKGVLGDEASNQPGNAFNWVNDGKAPGSCVLCHMYQTPGGVWDTKASMAVPGHQLIGGHAFAMVTEKDGVEVEHTAPCQQCHPGTTTFDIPAGADYDGDGTVEGAQTEVNHLRELLTAAILAWKDADGKSITLDEEGGFVTTDLKLTTDIKAAIYNLTFVGNAGSVHNFTRSVGLLQVSIFKVSGKNVPNAILLYGVAEE